MISNTVTNIEATTNVNGILIHLSFTAVATHEDGTRVERPIKLTCAIEPDEDGEFDNEELTQVCVESPEYQHACSSMRSEIFILKTPVYVPPVIPELTLEHKKSLMMNQIDNQVANVMTKYTRFQMGYVQREAAAQAYVDNNCEGEAPFWVTSFADRAQVPHPDAARLILAQAAGLRKGVEVLEDLRMRKYEVQRAETEETAQGLLEEILAEIVKVEGELP